MSLLINNDLIWISIPRCASTIIEETLINSNLNIQPAQKLLNNNGKHFHIRKFHLFKEFGKKETVCISRDWFERWLSALQYFFDGTKYNHNLETIIDWEDIDNNFIFKNFDYDFTNKLYNGFVDEKKWLDWEIIYKKLVRTNNMEFVGHVSMFISENYWKENEPCTYQFELKKLNDFYNFLEKKYGVKFEDKSIKKNNNTNTSSKIIVNNELKNFIWDRFEKPFLKNKIL